MKVFKNLVILAGFLTLLAVPAMSQTNNRTSGNEGMTRGDVENTQWALAYTDDGWPDPGVDEDLAMELDEELDDPYEEEESVDWLKVDEEEWDWDTELEEQENQEWEEEVDELFRNDPSDYEEEDDSDEDLEIDVDVD